jgi:5,10-methylenetetrahydromethanopterin reductase
LKFSLRLNNDRPAAAYITLAQAAERAGFDQFWVSNDLFLRSAVVILTTVAQTTSRIEIGTCILNPYSINPAEIAMIAATLDEISGGRFNLGISSGAGDFLEWIGIEPMKPRTAVVETVQAVNQLLNGERAACNGQFLGWGDETYLRFSPRRRVPIYIGAMSPNMLRAIGEVADGGLPLLFPPEHYQAVIPYIRQGAERAGRAIASLDIAACIWCSIAEDYEAAIDALKAKVAYYGHAMSPMILTNLGLKHDDFTDIERAAMVENDLEKAKSLVTEPMLRIGIAGTPPDLVNRLETLVEMGVRHVSLGPPLGPEPLTAIELIGRQVLPYFRRESDANKL